MGALAPVTPWIPEDDLALKNAIEGGASLPALAKGAVHFSRRYTLKEIEDRWRSLLYDADISAEASALMIECERNNGKSGRYENSKERKKCRKRKVSVRSCYYARRKRIRTEALSPSRLDFVEGSGGDGCHSGNEPPEYNTFLGDPMGKHFPLSSESNFASLHHVFQQADNIDVPSQEFKCGNHHHPVDTHNNACQEMLPQFLENNISCSAAKGVVGSSKELVVMPNIFENSDMSMNPMNGDSGGMCPEYGGNHVFSSPNSDFETSFHHLNYPSTPPVIPDWRNIEGIPPLPHMGDDGSGLGGYDFETGDDAFQIPNDGVHIPSSEYNAVHLESELINHAPCTDLKQSTSCETSDFAELSSHLWDDLDDEEMFVNVDDCNLLLDSPGMMNKDFNMDGDEMVKVIETESGARIGIPSYSDPCVMENAIIMICNSEEKVPSVTFSVDPEYPEYRNGVIWCTLNTEDPDIPFNDDIIFPTKLQPPGCSSGQRKRNSETSQPSSSLSSLKGGGGVKEVHEKDFSVLSRELERFRQLHGGGGSNDCVMNRRSSRDNNKNDENVCLQHGKGGHVLIPKVEGNNNNVGYMMMSRQVKIVDPPPPPPPQQHEAAVGSKECEVVENVGGEEESEGEDGEEVGVLSEEEDDIPCYSDVESMIVGMDLDPLEDEDLCVMKDVAKYMGDVAQRKIVRLEQGANGSIQRAMACRGALAVLISHYSKYYIKKHKVQVGRRTGGRNPVDIDLGRELRANKISRRQATIKLEDDGTFRLYNTGKAAIFVNSKRVQRHYCITLNPNSLIEIRGVPFTFEVNRGYLKRFLDSV